MATNCVATSNLRCRQAVSLEIYDFIIKQMQLDAFLPREEFLRVIDAITHLSIAQVVREGTEHRFAESTKRLHDMNFDLSIVHTLKSILCLLANPEGSGPPVLLVFGENRDFTILDYCELFCELMAKVASFGLVMHSIDVGNLSA
jgi:hypothetical protein